MVDSSSLSSNPRILAVVPARGGSKGVPRKNIRLLNGKPLIIYTLDTASTIDTIDTLVVSTDDDKIAKIVEDYGVKVIQRPSELALDTSTTEVVLLHALEVLKEEGKEYDVVLVLEPTSPLRSDKTIEKAISMVVNGVAESVLSVRKTWENIGYYESGFFRPVLQNAPRRRQLRDPFYIESSTIYAVKTSWLMNTGTLVCKDWGALVVNDIEASDINTEGDFLFVEYLIKKIGNGK
jgi:CMP-N,N'-diacetyllegionaminic acid synthase